MIHDPVYSATGHILFARTPVNEGIWALPFSLERLDATGAAYLVEAGLGTPSVSTTGTFLYLPAATTVPTRLQWFARDGTALEAIGEAAQFEAFPELSPDGTQVAISERVSGTWGLSVIDLARGTRVRLAAGERVSTPAWAPDGRSILYSSTPLVTADPVIRRVWLDGSPSENLESGLRPVSRDGLRYFFDRFRNNDFDLLVGTLDRTAPVGTFVGGALADVAARPSPDGRLVAYMSMPSITVGNPEVVLRRYPATDARWQVSSGGGSQPALEPQGRPRLLQHRGRYLRGGRDDEWRHVDAVAAASPLRASGAADRDRAGWLRRREGWPVSPARTSRVLDRALRARRLELDTAARPGDVTAPVSALSMRPRSARRADAWPALWWPGRALGGQRKRRGLRESRHHTGEMTRPPRST